MHFLRRVEIRAIRFFVDHTQDESYTPIHILWHAGTGHHDLIQFGEQALSSPSGWQDVKIEGLGGGSDGNSLCCYIAQMHVKENHQNGKDTHIRGIKVYALDENAPRAGGGQGVEGGDGDADGTPGGLLSLPALNARRSGAEDSSNTLKEGAGRPEEAANAAHARFNLGGMSLPDFMREPEIR
jgi:anaphase-promoting complex subunit 10